MNSKSKNGNWKGSSIKTSTGNDRARRWFPITLPCRVCGIAKTERHHKDGNAKNNSKENIDFLCRKHHMEADGRLKKLLIMSEFALPKAIAKITSIQKAQTTCKRGHALSGENVEIRIRADTGTEFRICKTCRRIRDRISKRRLYGFTPHPNNSTDERDFFVAVVMEGGSFLGEGNSKTEGES